MSCNCVEKSKFSWAFTEPCRGISPHNFKPVQKSSFLLSQSQRLQNFGTYLMKKKEKSEAEPGFLCQKCTTTVLQIISFFLYFLRINLATSHLCCFSRQCTGRRQLCKITGGEEIFYVTQKTLWKCPDFANSSIPTDSGTSNVLPAKKLWIGHK